MTRTSVDPKVLDEAHRRVRDFATALADEGIPDDVIIDAFLCVGTNAYAKLTSRLHLAQLLRRIADQIEAGQPGSGRAH